MTRYFLLLLLMLPSPLLQAQSEDPATDADAVQLLIDDREFQNAIARVDAALDRHKRDERLLLQRGLILVQLGRYEDARSHYKRLIRWLGDNPEPRNNLAMVYRYQGEYENAIEEFERTIREFPQYAQAHENLGDTYVEMAANAYREGTTHAPESVMLVSKLEIAGQFGEIAAGNTQAARRRALAEAADGDGNTVPEATRDQVLSTLGSWIDAWSKRDAEAYLQHYSREFDPGDGRALADWIGDRREALSGAASIRIYLDGIRIAPLEPGMVSATFEQFAETDGVATNGMVTLTLRFYEDRWLILREDNHSAS